jgi:hypothetical protein
MNSISYKLSGKYGVDKETLIDLETYELIKGRRISVLASGYVMIWNKETEKAEYFHRWLFNLKTGDKSVVDHVDGNKLNNQKSNLRLCNISENMCNRKKLGAGSTTSKFKGVSKSGNKWRAVCRKNKIVYELGSFETEKEAAEAYNEKAKELHEGYALLNII